MQTNLNTTQYQEPSKGGITSFSKKPSIVGGMDNCPVMVWNNFIYYAFSYEDNKVSLCIVAYDDNGNVAKEWEQPGARGVYKITVDEKAEKVIFWGQENQKVEMEWVDLIVYK